MNAADLTLCVSPGMDGAAVYEGDQRVRVGYLDEVLDWLIDVLGVDVHYDVKIHPAGTSRWGDTYPTLTELWANQEEETNS